MIGLIMKQKEKNYSKNNIGFTTTTKEGYQLEVIAGGSKKSYVTAKIRDYVIEVHMGSIRRGAVRYPYHKSVFDTGYLGVGKHSTATKYNGKIVYDTWNSMLQRCYSKGSSVKTPTYKNVTVHKDWHNFQNFAEWFLTNSVKDYVLDKDLLSTENNKIYSKDTCIFIPRGLNSFITSIFSNNTSGVRGVSLNKNSGKWRAFIFCKSIQKNKYLGQFTTKEEAISIYKKERAKQAQVWKDKMKGILPQHAIDRIK